MKQLSLWFRLLLSICVFWLQIAIASEPVWAAIDPYVTRYLKVTDPIPLEVNEQQQTRLFSAEELSDGKRLFLRNCINCHVGGTTIPNPIVSLSLDALHGATPRRDTINGLVTYLRRPMTYDGTEETIWCREVPESWLSQQQIENLAGFILRAAQVAPGWGTETFQGE
ncbi:photosystem II cytochrome PsbV2 [Leptothermofonsia sp. ETS-13]|uniref:photosystem II cytochrome PsbV2 n=1 Tax=Leptothermofonsia sp. ETS-13 TaxID=3035696 RepID=UPI003B9EE3C1